MMQKMIPSVRERVVALEPGNGNAVIFIRTPEDTVVREEIPFHPFIVLTDGALLTGFGGVKELIPLSGDGIFRCQAVFPDPAAFEAAKKFLKEATCVSAGAPNAPYKVNNDLTQQALMTSGIRLFGGMQFCDIRRMQLDIETLCGEGYDFSSAERESDAVCLISLRDSTGWEHVISANEHTEKEMLEEFIRLVQERDPDILEGHNLFRFDLPYLETRAKRHKLKLKLGRDGSAVSKRSSRFNVAERTVNYPRYDVYGRHIADTYHLALFYDSVKRDLDGYSLKVIAKHFKVARKGRVYIDAGEMDKVWKEDPVRAAEYCLDDVRETSAISEILSPAYFYQTQLIPLSYQNCIVRGNATRIDSLFMAEYLRVRAALPAGERARPFTGALTRSFTDGVYPDVMHCDVRSLYPSIILSHGWNPVNDTQGIFLKLLDQLRTFRLAAKDAMKAESDPSKKNYYSALQSAFKILINSFYGYLGFEQGFLNDFDMAERVTAEGRRILETMLDFLVQHKANVIEMDTDGIYFQPPAEGAELLKEELPGCLPKGIEVDFDESYPVMFSYKSKNYALLKQDGELVISGAALKSRGLEPFQRKYMNRMIRAILARDRAAGDALNKEFGDALRSHAFPFSELAKSETLADSPETYKRKMQGANPRRSAAYELVIKAGRDCKQGDQVSFYITGTKKKASVVDNAKLLSEADPAVRDENVEYYLGKLEELRKKFECYLPPEEDGQMEFKLEF